MDPRFDLLAIGEPMVEFNQTGGAGSLQYLQGFGGDTSNAAIAASRQGARCAYFTHLGDDDFGRMLLQLWRREGVACEHVALSREAHTGIYFVRHDEQGHSFSYLRAGSAASRVRPQDLPEDLLRGCRFLHVSAISQAISPSATETVASAMALARAAGAQVSYDPNLRLRLWPLERARAVIVASIAQCDHFLPSLDDVRPLCGLDAPDAIIDWCHAQGARTVVLKLGAQGCIVSRAGERVAVPAHRVDAVDATGAGDCFDGSYLARLAAGDDAVAAARWATAAAALATTGFGAVDPLPRPEQVRALLAGGAGVATPAY